jgi:protein disulfide-isomerase
MQKTAAISGFLVGLIGGLALYQIALVLGDFEVVSKLRLEQQQLRLVELEQDNLELTDELFRPRPSLYGLLDESDLPYDGDDDASDEVAAARALALAEKEFLMVTFGANWCQDCRSLHMNLHKDDVQQYTTGLFRFVNVDVGKFNQNRHVADELGVSLSRGIPVAVFFDPQGQLIGNTNEGELEPARRYSSRQILKFVRDIAERSRIQAPDAVD